jgi:hypothetical protein
MDASDRRRSGAVKRGLYNETEPSGKAQPERRPSVPAGRTFAGGAHVFGALVQGRTA